MHYELGQKRTFKVETSWWICFLQTHSCSLHKMLTDGLDSYGSLYCDYCDVWTLILTAPIHCRGSIGEQNVPKSVLMKKRTWMAWGWIKVQQIFISISLKCNYLSFCSTSKTCPWSTNKTSGSRLPAAVGADQCRSPRD